MLSNLKHRNGVKWRFFSSYPTIQLATAGSTNYGNHYDKQGPYRGPSAATLSHHYDGFKRFSTLAEAQASLT